VNLCRAVLVLDYEWFKYDACVGLMELLYLHRAGPDSASGGGDLYDALASRNICGGFEFKSTRKSVEKCLTRLKITIDLHVTA
jgi:hypothetical protein